MKFKIIIYIIITSCLLGIINILAIELDDIDPFKLSKIMMLPQSS
jgi:hypothetical protein